MVGRILRSADFQRVLAVPPRSRSTHFAAHHVPACPSLPARPAAKRLSTELSTGIAPSCPPPVDTQPGAAAEAAPASAPPTGCWLGLVVPKKHARRAVTRNLIKRQMRAVVAGTALPAGLWVLRLKAPFDRKLFTSPASAALQQVAHDELQQLLQRAAAPRR